MWNGDNQIRIPFKEWDSKQELTWYKVYNETKHDRQKMFENANFEILTDVVCGLVVLLASQFHGEDFIPGATLLSFGGPGDGMEQAIGEYFRVEFPNDWPLSERYDFDQVKIKDLPDPVQNFAYNA